MGIVSLLAAGITALAAQAGQSIQQWINSPEGQRIIHKSIQTVGQGILQEVFKKLGLD